MEGSEDRYLANDLGSGDRYCMEHTHVEGCTNRYLTYGQGLENRYLADGIFPIQQVRKDPLFKGLPKNLLMRCSHSCEVKKLPRDFELIASSAHCKIEGMRHKTKTLYGVQFHPEAFAAPYFHGRTLLENFADIVNDYWPKRS